uniref:Uncharacterized protein n=1 Tax=Romanomermis culicivorax TaxID=13658 RepID=A0A915K8Q0_ROMCU
MPSEWTTCCSKQRNQQKAHEEACQTSSLTSGTPQPKVKTKKTAEPAKHKPPAGQSDSHCSRHESHYRDDRHQKATQQPHTTSRDSCQHEHPNDAPLHRTQSEQTRTVHSTGFYEEAYKHAFRQSPPKLTDYISPLQGDAKIQERLEALKNQLKPVFKVPLTPPPPMDVEPATSSSMSLPPRAMSLLPTAPTSATATTVTHTTSLPPTALTSVQTTTAAQPPFVTMTQPVLRVAPPGGTAQRFEPCLSTIDQVNRNGFGKTTESKSKPGKSEKKRMADHGLLCSIA